MARPWALPVEPVMTHTSQSAALGGQLVIVWLTTLKLVWLAASVPSTARPPAALGRVGKLTLRLGIEPETLAEKGWAALGSIE